MKEGRLNWEMILLKCPNKSLAFTNLINKIFAQTAHTRASSINSIHKSKAYLQAGESVIQEVEKMPILCRLPSLSNQKLEVSLNKSFRKFQAKIMNLDYTKMGSCMGKGIISMGNLVLNVPTSMI